MSKKAYIIPDLVVYGTIESLTRGPELANTNDNWQGNPHAALPAQVGCQPSGHPVVQQQCDYNP